MYKGNKLSADLWIGKKKELRKSYRRKTVAPVTFSDSPSNSSTPSEIAESRALNISLEGAFIQNEQIPPVGTDLYLRIVLPTQKRTTVKIGGRVTRTEKSGFGLEFKELHTKDRSVIRNYVGFAELDDSVVSIQNAMEKILNGNLLPFTDPGVIRERIEKAYRNKLNCLILPSIKKAPFAAKIDYSQQQIVLCDLEKKIHPQNKVVYVIVIDGPLHAIFEGLIKEPGDKPKLLFPDRIYLNDRRSSKRAPAQHEEMLLNACHLDCPEISFPVVEKSEGGCSVLAPKQCLYTVGMRFPGFELKNSVGSEKFEGATISRIKSLDSRYWLLGLHFFDQATNRDTFNQVNKKSLRSSFFDSAKRVSSLTIYKLKTAIGSKKTPARDRPYVVRYKNPLKDTVVSLLDATFDLHAAAPHVDAVVVIAPPFPVRKEVFGLLSRTLVDNFQRQGKNAVILRFDLTHALGESEVDPKMAAKGHPYQNWTYSNLMADISGSLSFLEKSFVPDKRILITYSASAVAARKLIVDPKTPKVDHWVSPFGCPDGQDMLKNLLAGVDLVEAYHRGEPMAPFLIYGRFFDPNVSVPDAVANKMTRLEDARNDMSQITIPVTWMIGTYDYMVTKGRVKEMLNAPGGGIREVIELPTGHNPRTGEEAIESFKLIYESISKHMFKTAVRAVEPDLARFKKQSQDEWGRSKKNLKRDMEKFWEEHLFGTSQEKEGYDVLLYSPEYLEFIAAHVDLLDLKPDLRVADFGCGTGNLSAAMIERLSDPGNRLELSCFDLVGAAVERTQKKLEQVLYRLPSDKAGAIKTAYKTLDLETARMSVIREFLEGKLYSVKALIGRIEGLNVSTVKKLAEHYSQDLHDIIHGARVTISDCQRLCPELDESEAEELLELSRASRFIQNKVAKEDMITPGQCRTAKDLHFNQLMFGMTTPKSQIDCPSNAFDRIGASLVIPYLYDPESVIKEFYRVLDDKGVLVLSSLKPNSEGSKAYFDHAKAIAGRDDIEEKERNRLLNSLREFSAFLSRLVELEDEGRFHFFPIEELVNLLKKAGFSNIQYIESLGNPPTAVIIRAEKP